jgi:type I restriction enzyme S subunit
VTTTTKKISEIVIPRKEAGHVGVIPYLEIGDIDVETKRYVLKDKPSVDGCKLAFREDIVVSRVRPTRGAISIICEDRLNVSNAFSILKVRRDYVIPKFLFYTLAFNPKLYTHFYKLQKGSSYPSCREEDVLDFKLDVPPLNEQEITVKLLESLDLIREKRRRANQLTKQFLQSAFLEIFGDPVTNPKGWDKVKIGDIGFVQTGNTPPRNITKYYGQHIEWIKTGNIIPEKVFPTRSHEGLSEDGTKLGRVVQASSILVTCIAGSATSIGNAVLTDRAVAFNQQINAITPYEDVDPWFLYGLFVVFKPIIQKSTTLGMKRIITKSRFENLVVIKPPIEIQLKYTTLVKKVVSLRAKQKESEKELENLFQSLMQRAFKGELVG